MKKIIALIVLTLFSRVGFSQGFMNGSFEYGDYYGWQLYTVNPSYSEIYTVLWDGDFIWPGNDYICFESWNFETAWNSWVDQPHYATEGIHLGMIVSNDWAWGEARMYQDIVVPSITGPCDAPSLEFDLGWQDYGGGWDPFGQYIAIHIRDANTDALLETLYNTSNEPYVDYEAFAHHSYDISAYAGMTIRVDLEVMHQYYYLDTWFDNFYIGQAGSADVTAPVADNPVLPDVSDPCSVSSIVAPTATDDCVGTVVGTPDVTFPVGGSTTITWSFTDNNGNISTQTQNVIIDDVTAPIPDLGSLPDVIDPCSVSSIAAPTATDYCAGSITGVPDVSFPILGSSTVTWSFSDNNGNISTQTQNVIIEDAVAPVPDLASLPDVIDPCMVTSIVAPTAQDNCLGAINGIPDVVFPVEASTTITWTFDDTHGNMTTQTQNVIINDIDAPVADIALLPDVTSECEITVLNAPTATDACGGNVTVSNDATLPISSQGTTVVTWTYSDASGNMSTQTQNIVLADVSTPVPAVPVLATVNGCVSYTPDTPTATDNCSGVIEGTPDVTFPITTAGTTVVTWTYDDGHGNTSSQTQEVIMSTIDNSVTQDGEFLSANITGVSYQWINCDNANEQIPNEIFQYYQPQTTGNYAVIVSDNGCVDTSACILVDFTGLNEMYSDVINVYPNPSKGGQFFIEFNGQIENIDVLDILGSRMNVDVDLEKGKVNGASLVPGKYMLRIRTAYGTHVKTIVVI